MGISVTAFNGDQLRELGFTNTTDITAHTPGLTMKQFHPSNTVLNIRGVSQNDFSDTLEAPVAVYTDESYVSAMGAVAGQLYDIERVEILRGPQGSLFGRNATGGLVHYVSRKPTDSFEGYGEFTAGSYSQLKFEGAAGGPLTENVLGRLSFTTNHHDGYNENRTGADLLESDTYSIRGQLLLQPNEDIDMLVKVHYANNDEVGHGYSHTPAILNADGLGRLIGRNENAYGNCAGCDLIGYRDADTDPHTNSYSQDGYFHRSVYGVSANISWDFNDVTITSITDYLGMEKNLFIDTDGTPLPFFTFQSDQDFEQVSQEIRLNGETDSLRWVAGLYYLNIETRASQEVNIDLSFPFGFPVVINPVGVADVETESWAIFGQVEVEIAPEWTVIVGARYTEDDKQQDFIVNDPALPLFDLAAVAPNAAELGFENVSVRAEVDWRPDDDWLVYVSYNRGHKGGGWAFTTQLPLTGAVDYVGFANELPHDEEVLNNYEIGFKADLFDGLARLNTSAFYYDYNDYQAFSLRLLTTSIVNVDASVKGAEVELTVNPMEGLDILLGVAVLDTKIEDLTLPSGRVANRKLPLAPDFSLNGLIRYEWPAFNGILALQGDFLYNDNMNFDVFNAPITEEASYFVTNARLSYTTSDERWKLAVFVKNIGDETYRHFALDGAGLGFANATYGPPRWVGGSVNYSWK